MSGGRSGSCVDPWSGYRLRMSEIRVFYRLEKHPKFLRRIRDARSALRDGLGVRLEDLPE